MQVHFSTLAGPGLSISGFPEFHKFFDTAQDSTIPPTILDHSIPFRFKAGASSGPRAPSMAPTPPAHSHRSTSKTTNKPFKSKHSSKSALKKAQKGKVEGWETGSRKTPHQQVMSKIDRRHQAKQRRQAHRTEREEKGSIFSGRHAAPRIVAVVPLCGDIDSQDILHSLNESVDVEDSAEAPNGGQWIPRFKQRVTYLTPSRQLVQCLDACRVADFVLFVLSANEEVDELGEHLVRCVESQGVSTVLAGVWALNRVEPAKKRPDVLKSLKSFITHFFAAQEKVHDLSNRQECSNVMRSLCTTVPKGVRWREDRSWMLVEHCTWEGEQAVITGVVRGKGLKADRLISVGEWGDFQIEKIVDASEGEKVLDAPTEEQDDLAELAPEEAVMDDIPTTTTVAGADRRAVLLDDHHYFNEDRQDQYVVPKRLPRGTSKYQAAWYLGDVSDSGSDLEDVDDEDDDNDDDDDPTMGGGAPSILAAGPEDGHFAGPEPTEYGGPSEYPQSEMFLDPAIEDEADQLEEYRKQRRTEADEDLEFPDEIELSPHVDARERLLRYRGLKSLRTSHWDTEEDKPHEPSDWSRLLEISDYRAAKNKVLKEARLGGIPPGTHVAIHLRTPSSRVAELRALKTPTAVFGLLKHEHKLTAINISITLSSDYSVPLRSKEELILQVGPRRLVINPLFSAVGNTPNNVHKFDRFLHPGRTAVATFMGPVCWGSVPCLFFKAPTTASGGGTGSDAIEDLARDLSINHAKGGLELIATGTTLPPSTSRIVAKRIILTGHPYKIHKKLVTVRYMFFNDSDVRYFSALQLWTKRGRSGYIKEPLGTHGYFKATFDGRVNPLDSVGISLYKRVWPRMSRAWRGGEEEEEEEVPSLMEVVE